MDSAKKHIIGSLHDFATLRGLLAVSSVYVPARYQLADLTPYLLS